MQSMMTAFVLLPSARESDGRTDKAAFPSFDSHPRQSADRSVMTSLKATTNQDVEHICTGTNVCTLVLHVITMSILKPLKVSLRDNETL